MNTSGGWGANPASEGSSPAGRVNSRRDMRRNRNIRTIGWANDEAVYCILGVGRE
jgi:hypothetical protein